MEGVWGGGRYGRLTAWAHQWWAGVHPPATGDILRPGGTAHESKWGVSWLKQCRGHCWWKTSEQQFRGAAWQECNGMTGAKGVEHAACIYSWKTEQRKVKRLSCFAYNLRREDSVKEDWSYQRKVVQKWWQWQCAFCWALSHHLLRSCSPSTTQHLVCWHRGLQVFAAIAHHIIVGREISAWTHVLSWKQGKLVGEKEG